MSQDAVLSEEEAAALTADLAAALAVLEAGALAASLTELLMVEAQTADLQGKAQAAQRAARQARLAVGKIRHKGGQPAQDVDWEASRLEAVARKAQKAYWDADRERGRHWVTLKLFVERWTDSRTARADQSE